MGLFKVAQLLIEQCAVFLALLMGASALHKIGRWGRALGAARELAGVPSGVSAHAAVAAACGLETLSAALLMAPSYRQAGARLAVGILALYLGLILKAIALGRRDIDCGCSFGAPQRALGLLEVGRNALLLVLAALVGLSGDIVAPATASEVLAGVAFLALYAALDQVMGLAPMRKGTVS
jgi:Methylamine utilisation protein MauE